MDDESKGWNVDRTNRNKDKLARDESQQNPPSIFDWVSLSPHTKPAGKSRSWVAAFQMALVEFGCIAEYPYSSEMDAIKSDLNSVVEDLREALIKVRDDVDEGARSGAMVANCGIDEKYIV